MKKRNKQKIILIALAILIPVIGLIGVLIYLKLFHKKDSK